ncbi:SDR family oxidoreductase [uncultured Gimesia sp.]|uniref:SDR family NAD(P)-dependent oxidoreductase n=1 Tax=uncultured Gimesia sp. TaxID=1678688 RepID=UPI002628A50B|nr:SDR family oxidoreductase [uncultured Gimesia sp.]
MSTGDAQVEPKKFVVLGATGSVGSELSRRLIRAGHEVFLGGRDQESLQELAEELSASTHIVEALEPESIEGCLKRANDELGGLDGVVNCIGSVLLKPAHLTSDAEWSQTLAVNLTSAFTTVRSGAKVMGRSGGSIVLISSAAARIGIANHEAIAAAKAGVIGLTQSAAATYANRGIRVNAVAPGLIKSKMTRSLWQTDPAEATSIEMHAMGRLGNPGDVASMIQWLLQAENDWITGQVLGIDGGLATLVPRTRPKKSRPV